MVSDAYLHAASVRAAVAPLTERQREVLAFVYATVEAHGRRPTYREVGAAMGISSMNGVACLLAVLGRKGYIRFRPGRSHTHGATFDLLRYTDGRPVLGFRPILGVEPSDA